MKCLLLGSGGREHALAYKLAQSDRISEIFVAPGSDAIGLHSKCVDIELSDFESIHRFCVNEDIDLVVVGSEAPLVDGIADFLQSHGIKVFGPGKYAAQLEGSKNFTKQLCKENNIPTARYEYFENLESALSYIKTQNYPLVLKADGLAAGKGVVIAQTSGEAKSALEHIFENKVGGETPAVVIEEFLQGEEASLFVITDGENCVILPPAQDHKRAFDGDEGPNTGGMGAYAPAPLMTSERIHETMGNIIHPTLKALKNRGFPFKGVLYAGLMITKNGAKLIEYNVRFGDPECQALMLLLNEDLGELIYHTVNSSLKNMDLSCTEKSAVCLVYATKGYPDQYPKLISINGLNEKGQIDIRENICIFHAGTKNNKGNWYSNGGRVLNMCAQRDSLEDAISDVYRAAESINWPDGFYRTDIGAKALKV